MHLGLIGCGRWGKNILRDLLELGAQVSVIDPDPNSRAHAISAGAQQAFATIEEPGNPMDGYVIATPAAQHRDDIIGLLPLNRPIFVEKPITRTLDEAKELNEFADIHRRVFAMHKWRYHPGVVALAELAQSGALGKVQGMRLQRTDWSPLHDGVDCAQQLIPHDLSIVLHILGHLPALDKAIANPLGDPRMGVWACLRDSESDLRITLEASLVQPGKNRSCLVGFEQGVAILSNKQAEQIQVYRKGSEMPETITLGNVQPLFAQLQAFLEFINGGSPPLSSFRDALLVQQRLEEIRGAAFENT